MQLQGMDLNSLFLNAIDREAIKVTLTPTIKTAFLIIAVRQKLPRASYKSNVNNMSHCHACFLKSKFPWQKIFSFSSTPLLRWLCPPLLSNYR